MYTTSPEYNNSILDIAGRRFVSKVIINFTDTISKTYTDEDILSFSMLEENEILTNLIIGTVIGKSFDLVLFDPDQEYNPRNPNSTIAKYLKPNRVIEPFIGLELESGETEWIPIGIYYADNFQITEQDISVKITAMSVLPLLETIPYKLSPEYLAIANPTAYDLAKDVLDSSGFTNYLLMDFMKEYPLTSLPEFSESISSRQVLLHIAELCMCIVQDDREGKIYFDKIRRKVITQRYTTSPEAYNSRAYQLESSSNTEYRFPIIGDNTTLEDWRIIGETQKLGFRSKDFCDAQSLFPIEPYIILTFNDAFNVNKIIVQGDINSNDYPVDFSIIFYNYMNEPMFEKNYVGNTQTTFTTEQLSYSNIYVVELYIHKWSRPNTTAKITYFGLDEFIYSIDSNYYYRLTNKSNIETIVSKVTIKSVDEQEESYTNVEIYDIEGLYYLEIKDNPLILNQTLASKLATDILNYFTFNKLVQEVDWVGNPALTLADNLNTVDRFNNNSTVAIVSNKIDYNGALRMATIGMEETFGKVESQLMILNSAGYTIVNTKGEFLSIRSENNGMDKS